MGIRLGRAKKRVARMTQPRQSLLEVWIDVVNRLDDGQGRQARRSSGRTRRPVKKAGSSAGRA